jgi:hypothetical protein
MVRTLSVFIAIEAAEPPAPNEALTVARVRDQHVLLSVARAAIAEAEQEALQAELRDPTEAIVYRGECQRLRSVLSRLLPELREQSRNAALTM